MEENFNQRRRITDMMPNTDGLTDNSRLIILQNAVIDNGNKLEKHHKILLEGNGDLPLVERVRNLETFVQSLKFYMRTVTVAILLQTVTFAFAAVMYFIKMYPVLEAIAKQ